MATLENLGLSLERIMEAAEAGDGEGFCLACGAHRVYGAQEIVIMVIP